MPIYLLRLQTNPSLRASVYSSARWVTVHIMRLWGFDY